MRTTIFSGQLTLALGLMFLAPTIGRSSEGSLWSTDFNAAKAKAKAEKKLLLVDFTGSDWCGWCIRLKKEVFDEKTFQAEAPKQFVLVELDYPHNKKLPEELAAQNQRLAKEYKVRGFPTILVLDAEGKKVARTGYRPGGPEGYLKHLAETVKIYEMAVELLARVEKTRGLDRAKLLDQLVDAYEKLQNDSDEVAGWSKQIVALDANNKAGLRAKHEVRILLAEAGQLMQASQLDKAVAVFQKAVAVVGISAEQKQNAYFAQGECFFRKKDFRGTVDCLKKALEAAPDGKPAPNIKAMLDRFSGLAEAQATLAKSKLELDKAKGLDRAAVLDRLIEANAKLRQAGAADLDPAQIEKWSREIVKLDGKNEAGLKAKYESSLDKAPLDQSKAKAKSLKKSASSKKPVPAPSRTAGKTREPE